MRWYLGLVGTAVFVLHGTTVFAQSQDDADALELFRTRITPILNSPNASSCADCHLSGVDLKHYIGEDQTQTFAALVAAGLIDVDHPDDSKLLEFIRRAPEKPTPVRAEIRQREYEAFRAWIRAAVQDPDLAAARTEVDSLGPAVPVEVIRHTREDRVVTSFAENVWSEFGACVSCHSPELNRSKIGQNGLTEKDVDQISWIVPRDPAATLRTLVESGNIDPGDPEASPLLTKPNGTEQHGGGPKFPVGSEADRRFRAFLIDYAAVVGGDYHQASDLPEPVSVIRAETGQHLRIVDLPSGLGGRLLRAELYAWTDSGWSESPVGIADGPVALDDPLWQNIVFATAPRDSARGRRLAEDVLQARARPLPTGRYRIRILVDREGRLSQDAAAILGREDVLGEVEIEGEWAPGYQPPKIVTAPRSQ